MSKLIVMIIALITCGTVASWADGLRNDLLFYENCEDLKSAYPGVKIASSIRVEEKGKFGKCLRIERRTVNTLDNGDFVRKESDSWICGDNAEWKPSGGMKNSSCLQINGGQVSIPLTDIKPNHANAFSFYVKKADPAIDAELNVGWNNYGKKESLLLDYKPKTELERVTLLLSTEGDSGTVRISVKGSVIIDNAQLDKGVGFFNSFVTPMKKRYVDSIRIPADGKYINAEQGAISCWLKVPWLNDPQCVSDDICGLMTVKNAKQRIKVWGDHVILSVSAIPRKTTTDSPAKSKLHFITIDGKNRNVALSQILQKLPEKPADGWRHLVANWQLEDGQMRTGLWLDGKKISGKTSPFGPVKRQKFFSIGYVSGAYLNGLLDEFAVFNRPLRLDEIAAINRSAVPLADLLEE